MRKGRDEPQISQISRMRGDGAIVFCRWPLFRMNSCSELGYILNERNTGERLSENSAKSPPNKVQRRQVRSDLSKNKIPDSITNIYEDAKKVEDRGWPKRLFQPY